MLMKAVRKTLRESAELRDGDCLIVAVSGGVDSIVLLHLLRRAMNERHLSLVVAHLDHKIRAESDEDAAFVQQLSEHADLPFVGARADVPRWAACLNGNIEATAHDVRIAFLLAVARQAGARYICLGHSATDRAETFLMHLARGSGPDGLGSMPARSGAILRPLIDVSRSDILRYAEQHRLTWREDPTNQDLTLTRNRVRHAIAPQLEAINPRWVDAFCRASRTIAEQTKLVEAELDRQWNRLCAQANAGLICLDPVQYRTLPAGLRISALRRMVRDLFGSCRGWDQIHFQSMLRQAERRTGSADLPGCRLVVSPSAICLQRPAERCAAPSGFPSRCIRWGENIFDDLSLRLTVRSIDDPSDWIGKACATDSIEVVDADRIVPPLTLRSRRPGDRFRPLGMREEKRIKAFFIDEQIPAERRSAWPLVCDQNGIIWVTWLRLSDTVRRTPKTTRYVVLEAEDRRCPPC